MSALSTGQAQWDQLVRGVNCPFDAPRADSNDHWDLVAHLGVSSLYLSKNQTYRGHEDTGHPSKTDLRK